MPVVIKLQHAADRGHQVQDNTLVAFAARRTSVTTAGIRRRWTRWQRSIWTRSLDLFSGSPLIYRPGQNGYLLYSVGVNGKDEEGRSYDDNPPGDDLSVRALPESKK